jgi:hypothetical protein
MGIAQQTVYAFPKLRCTCAGRSLVPDIAVFTWDRIPRTEAGEIANAFTIHPDWPPKLHSQKNIFMMGRNRDMTKLVET